MLAYTFGTLLVAAVVVALIAVWIAGMVDVVRRRDLPPGSKALWLAVIFLVPFLGLLVYYLFRARPAY